MGFVNVKKELEIVEKHWYIPVSLDCFKHFAILFYFSIRINGSYLDWHYTHTFIFPVLSICFYRQRMVCVFVDESSYCDIHWIDDTF